VPEYGFATEKMSCGVRTDIPAYLPIISNKELIEDYSKFMKINLQLSKKSIIGYRSLLRIFLRMTNKCSFTETDIRNFLDRFSSKYHSKNYYRNMLKCLKVFFREYVGSNIMNSFKYPTIPFQPKIVPSKEQLRKFYYAIPTTKERSLFLLFATSGLRKGEVLGSYVDDVDLNKRMLIPHVHRGATKKSWIGFFNTECMDSLTQYLDECKNNWRCKNKEKLFNFTFKEKSMPWRQARKKTDIRITPKVLRDWFCVEMGELGVQDRYIDAFCGRVPKSILARHYTDYSPERLKRIYDKAGLRVLS